MTAYFLSYLPVTCLWQTLLAVNPSAEPLSFACMLTCFSCVHLLVSPWTEAHQAPLSKGFSRQEYLSGFPCPSPGDLPNAGIEPVSLTSPSLAGGFSTTNATWEAPCMFICIFMYRASQVAQWVKDLPANAGDAGLFPGSGRSPGGGHCNPLQYSCLENPMGREAWWATVYSVTKSQTPLE